MVRCCLYRSRDKGEAQVRKIVEAGVTTFVCLQEELPSQDRMKIGGHKGFMPYMSVAKGIAASLTGPSETAEMDGLRNPHIDRFLPPKRKENKSGRRQLSFVFDPIVDLNLPDKDQMLALVEQLKGFLTDGQVVYMHCWGGRGRAGTIASCFLASCYHLTADETADRIQLAFDTRNDGGRRSPETPDQRKFVKNFITELINMKNSRSHGSCVDMAIRHLICKFCSRLDTDTLYCWLHATLRLSQELSD
ncbi:TPA: hypothetical protein ACH3X1_010370 [Trebouxia sp. C0004]